MVTTALAVSAVDVVNFIDLLVAFEDRTISRQSPQ